MNETRFQEYLNKTWGEYIEENDDSHDDIYLHGFFLACIVSYYSTALPWLDSEHAIYIDVEWTKGRSYFKKLSPMIAMMEAENQAPIEWLDQDNRLVKLIKNRFADKWNKIHEALFADYDPIQNYSMIEEENTGTDMKTHTYEGDGAGNETENKVYGFNSETPVPSGKSEMKSAIQTEGAFDDNHRKLTRSGNIGVTTSQQMIESELELRRHQLAEIIMSDLDSLLCQRAY